MLKRILFGAALALASTAAIYPAPPILKRAELGFAVSTNAALQNLKSTEFTSAWRMGYYGADDSPRMIYTSTSAACSLNSGNGDGGSQIKLADGNCAVATFGGNHPSVRVFGAKGDGSNDDTPAFQAYVNWLAQNGAGRLVIPRGYYCIKTGPITTSQQGISFEGENRYGATVMDACGADVSIFNLSGTNDAIRHLQILGADVPGTTHPAVMLTGGSSGCVECTLEDVYISRGQNAVYANAYEVYIKWSRFERSYGDATVLLQNTGGYYFRNKTDDWFPRATPTALPITIANWAASTAVTQDQIVLSGGYLLQAMTT
ncbi:MAG TPA: glycosyl hydrolase family 28-related protein, partial [Stellaceae bacterium]